MFIILVLVLFVVICLKWKKVQNYWTKRNVPHLPPHPVLGSLTFILKANPGIWMRQISERFESPYVGAWWLWRPVLIVNDPKIARNVLVRDFGNFRNRLLSSGIRDPMGGLNIFTVNDPVWSDVRRSITKAFSSAKLKQIQAYMSKKSMQLIQRIKNDIDEEINLRVMFSDYTTDIITSFSFGIESDATLTQDGPFRAVTRQFMSFDLWRGLSWCSIFFCPELVDIFGFTFYPKSAMNYFRKAFNTIAQQYNIKNDNGTSLLDILIRMREENKNSHKYTDELIIAQVAIMLFGGFDTSASAMTFLLYELAHQPDIQEKLFNELQEAKRTNENSQFDSKQLSEIIYLDCVIKESLRKYPSMGWLDRIAMNDYEVDDKLTIKAGTPVYINAIGMHHNPKYFTDPYKFDPDRFLPENEKNIIPFTYMPFGDGPRSCIGQRFAILSLKTVVSTLILNYYVSPLPNKPNPSEIRIEQNGLFYSPGEKLSIKFTPRN